VSLGTPAGASVLGAAVLAVHDGSEAVSAGHGADDDAAAVAAVAAVRTSTRDIFLAAKAATAAATISPFHVQADAVYEHFIFYST